MERDRLAVGSKSIKAQINAQESRIQQFRALARLKRDQATGLKVRAGTSGVLQEVTVQVGQQLTPGFNIARVADPASLKAELKIAETQIKAQAGHRGDTRNGIIHARSAYRPAAREELLQST